MNQLPAVQAAAHTMNITLSGEQIEQLARYRALVLAGNARVNLTAVREPDAFERLHLVDALSLLGVVRQSELATAQLIDIGSGGGLPGLPLAILAPGLRVTLVEATGKKAAFLHEAVEALGLATVDVKTGRAEDLAHLGELRERFHICTARAVAELATLVELCLPFLQVGGRLLAGKNQGIDAEINAAAAALRLVGGRLETTTLVDLPGLADRQIVTVRKLIPTPPAYPRRSGLPAHQPLR
jgi:16S rRNA (guanine527-N7)-methyltransferase